MDLIIEFGNLFLCKTVQYVVVSELNKNKDSIRLPHLDSFFAV